MKWDKLKIVRYFEKTNKYLFAYIFVIIYIVLNNTDAFKIRNKNVYMLVPNSVCYFVICVKTKVLFILLLSYRRVSAKTMFLGWLGCLPILTFFNWLQICTFSIKTKCVSWSSAQYTSVNLSEFYKCSIFLRSGTINTFCYLAGM